MKGSGEAGEEGCPSYRVDCRGRLTKDVLLEVVPHCVSVHSSGFEPVLEIKNLGGLDASVSRLLKAFDRLAAEFGAKIKIADSSGLGEAFLRALAGESHLDLEGPLP